MKVSSTFSKVVESRGKASGRPPQRAESPLCSQKRRRGSKGEPSPGVPPFICSLGLYVCADTLGGGRCPVLPFDPISLVLAQRNGVEPPKKSAFLPWWLHHSREHFCLGGLYSSSPDLGRGLVRVGAGVGAYLSFILHILPKTQKSAANLLPCGAEFVMIYLKRR